MALPLVRTTAEALLYMELTACQACGETRFDPASSVIEADGQLASRYHGTCPGCGAAREFVLRLPDETLFPEPDVPRFGDGRPSELLDAGEWLFVADTIASASQGDLDEPDGEERRQVRLDLLTAAAAVDEALKFVPAGAEAVPADSFWSSRGCEVYAAEPGRFRRNRLEAVRRTYRELADRLGAPPVASSVDAGSAADTIGAFGARPMADAVGRAGQLRPVPPAAGEGPNAQQNGRLE